MKIIFGILSAKSYDERRERCRSTWVADAIKRGHDPLFLIGGEEQTSRHRDRLRLPVPDDYPSLPQKTRGWCLWSVAQTGWDWLFKCDDDTFVAVERLEKMIKALPPGTNYVGAEWARGVGYGSGGAGYLLSRHAAEIVADGLTCKTGSEDLEVGALLRRKGIEFIKDDRLVPFGSPDKRPLPGNAYITAHAFSAELFLNCASKLAV